MRAARCVIDDVLSGIDLDWIKACENDLPRDYLRLLLFGWAKASADKNTTLENPVDVVAFAPCTYHEHDDEVPQGQKCVVETVVKSSPSKTTPTKAPLKRKRF